MFPYFYSSDNNKVVGIYDLATGIVYVLKHSLDDVWELNIERPNTSSSTISDETAVRSFWTALVSRLDGEDQRLVHLACVDLY